MDLKKKLTGMTHPPINHWGSSDRAEACSGIFLTSTCSALSAWFLLLNPGAALDHYTGFQLGAQPQSLTVTNHITHSCVYVLCLRVNTPR